MIIHRIRLSLITAMLPACSSNSSTTQADGSSDARTIRRHFFFPVNSDFVTLHFACCTPSARNHRLVDDHYDSRDGRRFTLAFDKFLEGRIP